MTCHRIALMSMIAGINISWRSNLGQTSTHQQWLNLTLTKCKHAILQCCRSQSNIPVDYHPIYWCTSLIMVIAIYYFLPYNNKSLNNKYFLNRRVTNWTLLKKFNKHLFVWLMCIYLFVKFNNHFAFKFHNGKSEENSI